ncbi:hypothetical protein LCGC14_1013600 [marine sediment metagenome]|uniref:LamG-like jellyroll fold domain-containing protein n=1 Tax=marine sediment metagenome TaxID=412755 RepID=A0A0F9N3W2_9ZZZZ
MVLLVGNVSAFEWNELNDKLTYSNDDLKVSWENWWGLGETIGTVELKSHKSVEEVLKFGFGKEEVVMYYDLDFLELYENGLGKVYLTDKRTNKEIQKEYSFVYWTNETYEKNIYEIQCSKAVNGTDVCENVFLGKENSTREVWKPYNSRDIQKGKIRIGLKTYINKDDFIDGVWTIAGRKISKHALWSASDGMLSYYKFDDNTTNTFVLDSADSNDGTATTNTDNLAVTGKINSAFDFNGSTYVSSTHDFTSDIKGGDFTMSLWINQSSLGLDQRLFYQVHDTPNRGLYVTTDTVNSDEIQVALFGSSGSETHVTTSLNMVAKNWYNIVVKRTDGFLSIHVNDNLEYNASTTVGSFLNIGNARNWFFATSRDIGGFFDGIMDEVGIWNESKNASKLYNNGDGCFFGFESCIESSISIILNSPINNFNSSNATINTNGTIISLSPENITNVSLIVDSIYIETNSSGINNTDYLFTTILSEGDHNWTYEVCDNSSSCLNATTRNITIDTIFPQINITFPTEIIDFHEINTNLSVNWTVEDLNLDTCILEYEGVNRTVICLDNQTQINITNSINRTIIFYVNDTVGNSNSSTRTWDYKIFQNSLTYSTQTIEGSTEEFILNITLGSGFGISTATLIYNGTNNIGSFSTSGANEIITETIIAPSVTVDTNLSFFWSILLGDSSLINTTTNNQTVSFIGLDNCSVNSNLIFNYTIKDEGNQTNLINTTVDLNIDLFDSSRTNEILDFSYQYLETNPVQVCLNIPLLSSTNYSLGSVVKYTSLGYVVEYYNIVQFVLANSTVPQNINLYDLSSADSTDFKIIFRDDNFIPVENALIYIDRQYIPENNIFKTVELPKTDSNGETVGHFVRNDIVYNMRVVKDLEVLGNFENIIAFCQDITIENCQIILDAVSSIENTFDYNDQVGLIFEDPTFDNNTNIVSFSFLTPDGIPKEIRMEVTRNDIFGNLSLCNQTLTSSSGTLSCTVPGAIDETILNVDVFVNNVTAVKGYVSISSSTFGNLGYIVWFIFSLALMLMLGDDKTRLLISLIISYVGAVALSLSDGTIIGHASTGVWIIIVTMVGIWKLNKDNPQ